MKTKILSLMIAVVLPFSVQATDIKPAIVYGTNTKSDKSFNKSVSDGVKRFSAETKIKVRKFEPSDDSQIEMAIRKMAERGANPILLVSSDQKHALETVAEDFPNTRFSVIGTIVDRPNVRSITFREEQGAFLAGALAAMFSQTGKVGFIGGKDNPSTWKIACAYEQGVEHINNDAEVYQNMIGSTDSAWDNPAIGNKLAKSQMDNGVDIIFAAAGKSDTGIFQAAEENSKHVIATNINQNSLYPGTILASMIKKVETAAYKTFKSSAEGTWSAGINSLGLAEGGIGLITDQHNEVLVTPYLQKIMAVEKAIIDENIIIHNYTANNRCH
ncbi:MAG: BMP family lipoprotein [Thiolinea sp.]